MMTHAERVFVDLPPDVYAYFQHQAQTNQHPLERELVNHLQGLATYTLPDEGQLQSYTHEHLLSLYQQPFHTAYRQRLDELIALSKERFLTSAEDEEAEHLLDLADQYVILRSRILLILKERGHDISSYLTPLS